MGTDTRTDIRTDISTTPELEQKLISLQENLKNLASVAVAFSGGADSALLLKAAADTLGTDKILAVTVSSCVFPAREFMEAEAFCQRLGIRQIECKAEPLDIAGFQSNPIDRCYLCKKELFGKIRAIAEAHHMLAVAEGSNTDDNRDYRPGLRAVEELHIKSPLREAGLNKAEIRALSKALGLPTWDKQSFACLASRFVYGEPINKERLKMVEEAEQLLLDSGFRQVRVRIHGEKDGTIARIELMPEELFRLSEKEKREAVCRQLKSIGFTYVTLDLDGYRTGSMNETIADRKAQH